MILYFLVSLYRPILWKARIWRDMLRKPRILFNFMFSHIIVSTNILEVRDMGTYFENPGFCLILYFLVSLYRPIFYQSRIWSDILRMPRICLNGYILVSFYRPIFYHSRIWGDILRMPRILFDFIFPRIIISPNIVESTNMARYVKKAPYSV